MFLFNQISVLMQVEEMSMDTQDLRSRFYSQNVLDFMFRIILPFPSPLNT